MKYHPLTNETGGTADDRRSEGDRIIGMLDGYDDSLTEKELEFITDIGNSDTPISPKQLFWLRDIKDKYL